MKYGLTLEGGGARGAYHIGAVKALIENGYEFQAVVGTSIGAINAAFIAQGDFDKVYRLWESVSFSDLFNVEDEKIKNAMNINLDLPTIKYLSRKLAKIIKEKGIDTLKMRKMLEDTINEEKLRNSDIKFGLVTFCISDINGEELLIDDIKKGEVIDYLMASSNLPVFQRVRLNDKNYLDGGIYDNCPVNLIEKMGIKDVIVIRTYKRMRIRGYKDIIKRGNVNMYMIQPVDTLPSILNFDTNNLKELLLLGYFDALKMIKSLDGIRYYINTVNDDYIISKIRNMDYKVLEKITKSTYIKLEVGSNIADIFLSKTLPIIAQKTKNKDLNCIKDYVYALVGYIAKEKDIDKNKVYDFDELLNLVKDNINKPANIIELFVKSI